MAEIKETLPFNFEEIYNDIKTDFSNAGYDISEGSNSAMLGKSMAYTVSSLNANTALNINELILPYANRRNSIVTDARNFGYEIQHKVSYVYNLTMKLDGGNYVIPKFSKFTCGENTYYYIGNQMEIENAEPGTEIQVQVKEGTLFTYTDDPESLRVVIDYFTENNIRQIQYYIDIPYVDVEENGIEVFCTYIDQYGILHDKVQYKKADESYVEVDSHLEKQFIRIDNIEYGTPRIYFKYAGSGEVPILGTEVLINILTSKGSKGKIQDTSKPEQVSSSIANCTCTKIELVSDGCDEETNENIKTNAPRLYNSANRLVTANDYESACNRDGRVRDTITWGGEDEFPLAPGHIWFTFLPNNDRGFDSDEFNTYYNRKNSDLEYDYTIGTVQQEDACAEYYSNNYVKNSTIKSYDYDYQGNLLNPGIWDKLTNQKIPTLTYHNRHPIYCEFLYEFEIMKYIVNENKASVHQEIFNIIDNAFKGDDSVNYENFNVEYFNSSLVKRIDKRVTDISGFNDSLKTRLVLNQDTCYLENIQPEFRDIYIPLAVSYEKYFDDDGYLITDNLPKIDTKEFVKYTDEVGGDLYVDFSHIHKEIEDSKKEEDFEKKVIHKHQKLMLAPVRIRHKGTYSFAKHPNVNKAIFTFNIYPDSVNQDKPELYTYDRTIVNLVKKDGTKRLLKYGTDWFIKPEKPYQISFGSLLTVENTDTIELETNSFCGWYFIFNNLKKEILVHLFVDGSVNGFDASIGEDYSKIPNADYDNKYLYSYDDNYFFSKDSYYHYTEKLLDENMTSVVTSFTTPRSYLNSNDSMYMYTTDRYYLTTNGYALTDENGVNQYTGPVIKEINERMYRFSGLKYDLFKRNRYLDLNYPSLNFKVIRNVIPSLKSVKFKNVIE